MKLVGPNQLMTMIRTMLPLPLITLALMLVELGCGRTLEVGETKSAASTSAGTVLTSLASMPDFVPWTLAVADGAVYVAGTSFPGGAYDPQVKDGGRILRVSIETGELREVWRGPGVPGNASGTTIVFTEDAENNQLADGVAYSGIDSFDTRTERITRIPNAPNRDVVLSLALTSTDLVWSAMSRSKIGADGSQINQSGYTMARWDADQARTVTLSEAFDWATYIVREQDVIAVQFIDTGDGEVQPAIYRVTNDGFVLERVLTEIPPHAKNASLADIDVYYSLVAADSHFYYLQGWSPSSEQRWVARASVEPPVAGSYSPPQFLTTDSIGELIDRNLLYWLPTLDPSSVRQRRLDDDATGADRGDVLAFDPHRSVSSLAVDAANIYWISTSTTGDEPYRIMKHAR